MRERVLAVGKPTPLVGVMTEADNHDADKPLVLILNSGVMHHIGSCRLSVKIARAMAAAGFSSLRFDFSGIGDSEPRRGSLSFEESAPKETAEMMDYLEKKRGIKQFLLFGLCSGADAAYETAVLDTRVVGAIQIDAYCYATKRYYLNHYLPKLLSVERWKSFFARKLGLKKDMNDVSAFEFSGIDEEFLEVPTYVRDFPPRETVALGLEKLVKRGFQAYIVFTGGEEAYNYREQYYDSFPEVKLAQNFRVDHVPNASHIVAEPEYQRTIIENIVSWVTERDFTRAPAGV